MSFHEGSLDFRKHPVDVEDSHVWSVSNSELDHEAVVGLHSVLGSSSFLANNDLSSLGDNKTLENESKGTSWYAAIFLVVNAALGAGLLNFPEAFDQAGGILVGIVVQVVLLTFVIVSIAILAYCSDKHNSSTYQDVMLNTCGKCCQQLCSFSVILYCYGTCITFLIIIGDQFDRTLSSLYGSTFCHFWYFNRNFTIIFTSILVILPLCFPKRIDFLKYASSFGVIAVMYVVFLITYKFYEGKHDAGPIKTSPSVWSDVFLVVPVICFSYQCHVSCIPVYSCMKDRTVRTFLRTVIVAIFICVVTYTGAATYGYLTFGTSVASDIMESYDAKDPIVLIGIIAIIIKTYTTYPILLFCGRVAIDDMFLYFRKILPQNAARTECRRRVTIASVWFCSSLVFAIFIPNIGVVIQMLGSLAAVFIFIFPGLCLLKVTLNDEPGFFSFQSKMKIAVAGIFLSVGFLIFGLVFTQSIMHNINGHPRAASIVLCI